MFICLRLVMAPKKTLYLTACLEDIFFVLKLARSHNLPQQIVLVLHFPQATCTHSFHIHCRHTILAHLFFRDFSCPSLFSYSPRLSLSLIHSLPLSFTHSLPHLLLSLSLILSSSLSLPLLSLCFFPPFSFFPFKTIQPL